MCYDCTYASEIQSKQTDFFVAYVDPESNRLRKYYPDFFVEMNDVTT